MSNCPNQKVQASKSQFVKYLSHTNHRILKYSLKYTEHSTHVMTNSKTNFT